MVNDDAKKAVLDFLDQLEMDIEDRIEGYVDTRDGDYGEPAPNDAMMFVSSYMGSEYVMGEIGKLRRLLRKDEVTKP